MLGNAKMQQPTEDERAFRSGQVRKLVVRGDGAGTGLWVQHVQHATPRTVRLAQRITAPTWPRFSGIQRGLALHW
ncbi:hypothetical protein IF1G_04697 [Cordyceps javanica]|uniref:Uncharacterized protein n=1 Tax=Cordyceps javanica TaxID=43265 RepID=A0A545V316_9HYPO|nr:hypothetical protein IF1G_04697 [Cordyceps javanica]